MWLLNVHTFQLEEFYGTIPPYIILSHRWGAEELTFHALKTGEHDGNGYRKIAAFCRTIASRRPNVQYGWVDSCCIDKTNSTELSEAINSMYSWYQNAVICYAFLHDVEDKRDMASSEWFQRGWTLQELVAPEDVVFFNHSWTSIGTKDDLQDKIATITGISPHVLRHPSLLSYASVADRFSWAAKRKTTRIEDQAYCLLGLFNVNMPLIYGEGERAFYRLQEQIISSTNDQTIFTWHSGHRSQRNSLLAKSVSCFARDPSYPRTLLALDDQRLWQAPVISGGITISNIGIAITLLVLPYFINTYLVPLCYLDHSRRLCMVVSRHPDFAVCYKTTIDGRALRDVPEHELANASVKRLVFAPGLQVPEDILSQSSTYGFSIRDVSHDLDKLTAKIISHSNSSKGPNHMLLRPGQWGAAGILYLQNGDTQPLCIVFGYDIDFKTTLLTFRPDISLEEQLQTTSSLESLELHFPKLSRRKFFLESQLDWMSLISILKERPDASIAEDDVAFHQITRTVQLGKPMGKMLVLADYVTLRIYSAGMLWNSEIQTVHVHVSAQSEPAQSEPDPGHGPPLAPRSSEAWEVTDYQHST